MRESKVEVWLTDSELVLLGVAIMRLGTNPEWQDNKSLILCMAEKFREATLQVKEERTRNDGK